MSERDLGVQIKYNLKWDDQSKLAVAKANKALATLKRTFKLWDANMFKQLFQVYVRPHLEYAATIWNPYNHREIDSIERVQKRATRIVTCPRSLRYEDRLAELGMTSLADRRARGDQIQMFKCLKGININTVKWTQKWAPATALGPCTRQSCKRKV